MRPDETGTGKLRLEQMIENTIENARTFVSKARSRDQSRPMLCSIAYSREGEKAWLVASDTFRLHTCEIDPAACPCGENETKGEIPGIYPNWQRVVPTEHTRWATINAKQLETAIKACAGVAKLNAHRLRLRFEPGRLTLYATADDRSE